MRMTRCYPRESVKLAFSRCATGCARRRSREAPPSSDSTRVSAPWKFQVLARGGTGSFEVRVCVARNSMPRLKHGPPPLCSPGPFLRPISPSQPVTPTESLLFYSSLHRPRRKAKCSHCSHTISPIPTWSSHPDLHQEGFHACGSD